MLWVWDNWKMCQKDGEKEVQGFIRWQQPSRMECKTYFELIEINRRSKKHN